MKTLNFSQKHQVPWNKWQRIMERSSQKQMDLVSSFQLAWTESSFFCVKVGLGVSGCNSHVHPDDFGMKFCFLFAKEEKKKGTNGPSRIQMVLV